MSKTAFLTGATGFLGLNLVEQLCAAGWSVSTVHRASSDLSQLSRWPVSTRVGELLDRESLLQAIPEGVDAVFHVAGNISMWRPRRAEQTRDNVEGTKCVLSAARERGARRFVYTSSWATYGLDDRDLTEDSEQLGGSSPRNYARSKYQAEQAVKQAAREGFPAVVMNPAHIVGRYDRSGWGRMIRMIQTGKLQGVPPGSGSFCHAAAVARAHIAAAERGRPGENYLLGGVNTSFLEVAQAIGRRLDRPVPARPLPAWMIRLVGNLNELGSIFTRREPELTADGAWAVIHHPRVVSRRAVDELGYEILPLEVMLEDAITWMRSEGLI